MSDLDDAMEILASFYEKPRPRNEYELAIAEREVWNEYCRVLRSKGRSRAPRRSEWFAEKFKNVTGYDVEMRSSILSSGAWAQPVWELISNLKLPLRTAKRLVNKSKDVAHDHKIDRAEALRRVLQEYFNTAGRYESVTPGGATVLRRKAKAKTHALGDDPFKIDADVESSKRFIAFVEKLTEQFVDQRLVAVDSELERQQIATEFTMAVRVAYDELLKRIRRSRARPKGEHKAIVVITRQQIVSACEFLSMKPPKKGAPIDLELANRQHRKLSAQFHPDRTGNDAGLTEQFRQIQEAMDTVRAYAETIGATNTNV